VKSAVPLLLVVAALGGCGDDDSPAADLGARDAGPCEPGWALLFEDGFEVDSETPTVDGYPALPRALFPEDGTRWTQIQNSHEGENAMALVDGPSGRALECLASGQPDGVASKMDVGRQPFDFLAGDRVRITASLWVDGPEATFADNTLIDLEDSDDVRIDGDFAGAGLRIRTDGEGRLALDRGEIPGREGPGTMALTRLSTLRSDYVFPLREWVEVEVTLQLGVDVAPSTTAIDETFDEAITAGWVTVRVREEADAEPRLVLRMAGTTTLDPDALREVVEREAPGTSLSVDEPIDLDSFQIGATNNRSTVDAAVRVDAVRIEGDRCPSR